MSAKPDVDTEAKPDSDAVEKSVAGKSSLSLTDFERAIAANFESDAGSKSKKVKLNKIRRLSAPNQRDSVSEKPSATEMKSSETGASQPSATESVATKRIQQSRLLQSILNKKKGGVLEKIPKIPRLSEAPRPFEEILKSPPVEPLNPFLARDPTANPDSGYSNPDTGLSKPDTGLGNADTGPASPEKSLADPDPGLSLASAESHSKNTIRETRRARQAFTQADNLRVVRGEEFSPDQDVRAPDGFRESDRVDILSLCGDGETINVDGFEADSSTNQTDYWPHPRGEDGKEERLMTESQLLQLPDQPWQVMMREWNSNHDDVLSLCNSDSFLDDEEQGADDDDDEKKEDGAQPSSVTDMLENVSEEDEDMPDSHETENTPKLAETVVVPETEDTSEPVVMPDSQAAKDMTNSVEQTGGRGTVEVRMDEVEEAVPVPSTSNEAEVKVTNSESSDTKGTEVKTTKVKAVEVVDWSSRDGDDEGVELECRRSWNLEYLAKIFVELCSIPYGNRVFERLYADILVQHEVVPSVRTFLQLVQEEYLRESLNDGRLQLDHVSLARVGALVLETCFDEGHIDVTIDLLHVLVDSPVVSQRHLVNKSGVGQKVLAACVQLEEPKLALKIVEDPPYIIQLNSMFTPAEIKMLMKERLKELYSKLCDDAANERSLSEMDVTVAVDIFFEYDPQMMSLPFLALGSRSKVLAVRALGKMLELHMTPPLSARYDIRSGLGDSWV
nr:hypothetical protein BaRGS_025799 [Batillaria attramentaria]